MRQVIKNLHLPSLAFPPSLHPSLPPGEGRQVGEVDGGSGELKATPRCLYLVAAPPLPPLTSPIVYCRRRRRLPSCPAAPVREAGMGGSDRSRFTGSPSTRQPAEG
ncbi:hypothetical protein E2C01_008994 [Portunus trituberculatus]|uniref:Uncharacterized protein n=1 Tax=Portunus trituberculatus TaxID=210409 RepID=A0A5B7D4A7_PORTR|nr:hypothetical protein [Portunus trituberculatus]